MLLESIQWLQVHVKAEQTETQKSKFQERRKAKMKRTKSMIFKESHESRELELYAYNCRSNSVRNLIECVIENLAKKYKKGVYESTKAVDLWYKVATVASQVYQKEFCDDNWNFSVTDRFTAACNLEKDFFEDVENYFN